MKNVLYSFFAIILLNSCSGLKLANTLKRGEVKTKKFTNKLSFEYRLGLIIIPVEIHGNTYHFLLDTGAPNVVSPDLAKTLEVDKGVKHKTSDSQGGKSQLQFITIDQLNVGGIIFEDTGAAVADLSQSNEVACLKIDGIIGANLMRLCKWKIDYTNQEITIANDLSSFGIDSNFSVLKFEPELTGTPKISISLDGNTVENVKFDTGSVGFLDLPSATLDKINKSGNDYIIAKSFGVNGSGLFGPGQEDTMYYTKIDKIMVSDIVINNRPVEFVKDHSALLGTQFLKHFNVYLDWQMKEIYLQKVEEFKDQPFENFGLNFFYENDQLLIKELFENSQAQQLGLKNGDQIISLNGKDCSVFTKDDWCDFIESKMLQELKAIEVTVNSRDKIKEYVIYRQVLLE